MTTERVNTVVVGGGQAGLSVGYHLAQRGLPFIILDAHERIGDAWRRRWDSLRLFSPARYDGLAGMPFPAAPHTFPTKDEMADYLEAYAARFRLPVRTGVRVDGLTKDDGRFVLTAGEQRFEADRVVVAMSAYQGPRVPAFAQDLDPAITQLHANDYRNPSQLEDGPVLVVGAGNSGCEIALDAARSGHTTWLSGRDTGHIPFRIEGLAARLVLQRLVLRVAFHHVLTVKTPMGRRMRAKGLHHGMPLIRIKPKDLAAVGIRRVPRMVGIRGGLPQLEDGRVLEVANVVWSTGFDPRWSWIQLPIFVDGQLVHERGVVTTAPGLYFVGLPFVYSVSSAMVHGVGRDAAYVVRHIAACSRGAKAGSRGHQERHVAMSSVAP